MIFIIGFIFISVFGTILHFTYDYSNHKKIVGVFSAVNESVWEHIKIALTPAFIYSIVDGYFYGYMPNYFLAKLVGLLSIIIVIPLIYYGYKSIIKKNITIIDISSFFIAVGVSEFLTYKILFSESIPYIISYISLILIFVLFGFYLLLTLIPVKNFIFKDPITKKYGLNGHDHSNKK